MDGSDISFLGLKTFGSALRDTQASWQRER